MATTVSLGFRSTQELVEINDWCCEQFGDYAPWDYRVNNRYVWKSAGAMNKIYVFRHEKDALLFTLKWVK